MIIIAASSGEALRAPAVRALVPSDLREQLERAASVVGEARVRSALNGLRPFLS